MLTSYFGKTLAQNNPTHATLLGPQLCPIRISTAAGAVLNHFKDLRIRWGKLHLGPGPSEPIIRGPEVTAFPLSDLWPETEVQVSWANPEGVQHGGTHRCLFSGRTNNVQIQQAGHTQGLNP